MARSKADQKGGVVNMVWYCIDCGNAWEHDGTACPECGSLNFERRGLSQLLPHEVLRIVPETIIHFVGSFDVLQNEVHKNAVKHGWWEEERSDGELIALIHSELSEALEYLRKGENKSDHIPEFKGTEEEYADVIIRIMDHAESRGWNIAEAIIAKMQYNKTRPYKHGKKF